MAHKGIVIGRSEVRVSGVMSAIGENSADDHKYAVAKKKKSIRIKRTFIMHSNRDCLCWLHFVALLVSIGTDTGAKGTDHVQRLLAENGNPPAVLREKNNIESTSLNAHRRCFPTDNTIGFWVIVCRSQRPLRVSLGTTVLAPFCSIAFTALVMHPICPAWCVLNCRRLTLFM